MERDLVKLSEELVQYLGESSVKETNVNVTLDTKKKYEGGKYVEVPNEFEAIEVRPQVGTTLYVMSKLVRFVEYHGLTMYVTACRELIKENYETVIYARIY